MWKPDEAAGCLRDREEHGTVIMHKATCMNGTCRRNFALTFDKVSGEARQDWEEGCGTTHACKKRILGPLSDFKEYRDKR